MRLSQSLTILGAFLCLLEYQNCSNTKIENVIREPSILMEQSEEAGAAHTYILIK